MSDLPSAHAPEHGKLGLALPLRALALLATLLVARACILASRRSPSPIPTQPYSNSLLWLDKGGKTHVEIMVGEVVNGAPLSRTELDAWFREVGAATTRTGGQGNKLQEIARASLVAMNRGDKGEIRALMEDFVALSRRESGVTPPTIRAEARQGYDAALKAAWRAYDEAIRAATQAHASDRSAFDKAVAAADEEYYRAIDAGYRKALAEP